MSEPLPIEHDDEADRATRPVWRERGAGLVEYALLVALISLVCFSALQVFGLTNGGSINNTASSYGSFVN